MALKEIDRQIMTGYLQGKYSVEQLQLVREYLHNEAYRESLDRFLQEEWETLKQTPLADLPGLDQKYLDFRALAARRRQEYEDQGHGKAASAGKLVWLRPLRLAGAAAILLVAFGLYWLLSSRSSYDGKTAAAQWIVFRNPAGQRTRIVLPDSSVAWLGNAATLQYNTGYNKDNRRILLQGEAYFMVRHGGKGPFTVITGDIATIDIGTEFNIRYYPGQSSITVEVAKGNVEVRSTRGRNEARIAAIAQGQSMRYDSPTAKATTTLLQDDAMPGAWRNGILVFHRRPLKEVTDELERYYGITVQYANPASEQILLTTTLNNRSLDDALDIVAVSAGLHYQQDGNHVLLK